MSKLYVGYKINQAGREVFRSATVPTQASHGDRFAAVWGPFRTRKAADFAASWRAVNNPHALTVADVERIAHQ